jgi:hypothetical protein
MGYYHLVIKHELEIIMDEFITEDIKQRIFKCMNIYGLEGTEDKIKSLYNKMPQLKETWLEEYYKIIKG